MIRLGRIDPVSGPGARLAVGLLAVLTALFIAGAVVAPWLRGRMPLAGWLVTLTYRPVCHQISDRCLDLGAGPIALCARCLGLYVGGLCGLLGALTTRRAWRPTALALALVALPSLLDFLLGHAGLASLPNLPRLVVALPLGALLGSALACAAGDIFTSPCPTTNSLSRDPVE